MLKMELKFMYTIFINDSVNRSSQFISVKVKIYLRKSQAQFRDKLRKSRLRQNNDFLIKKKNVYWYVLMCIKSNEDSLLEGLRSISYSSLRSFRHLLHSMQVLLPCFIVNFLIK